MFRGETINANTLVEFEYRDDTKVQVGPLGNPVRIDDYAEKNSGQLPFGVGHRVRVEWRTSSDGKKKIAVKITLQG